MENDRPGCKGEVCDNRRVVVLRLSILVFVVLATVFSAFFREAFFPLADLNEHGGFSDVRILATLFFVAMGPVLAACACWFVFGLKRKTSTLLGTWSMGALGAFALPPLALAVVGYENSLSINRNLFGAFVGFVIVLYGVGEELGWRGFLNDQLRPAGRMFRIVTTAVVWWVWHLWFIQGSAIDGSIHIAMDPRDVLVSLALLIAASSLFVTVVDESHSILEVGAFHALGSIVFTMPILEMQTNQRAIAAGIVLLGLMAIHANWKKRELQMAG